jgi:hypothetical protein
MNPLFKTSRGPLRCRVVGQYVAMTTLVATGLPALAGSTELTYSSTRGTNYVGDRLTSDTGSPLLPAVVGDSFTQLLRYSPEVITFDYPGSASFNPSEKVYLGMHSVTTYSYHTPKKSETVLWRYAAGSSWYEESRTYQYSLLRTFATTTTPLFASYVLPELVAGSYISSFYASYVPPVPGSEIALPIDRTPTDSEVYSLVGLPLEHIELGTDPYLTPEFIAKAEELGLIDGIRDTLRDPNYSPSRRTLKEFKDDLRRSALVMSGLVDLDTDPDYFKDKTNWDGSINWDKIRDDIREKARIEAGLPIPEPQTYALMLFGLGVLALASRRNRLRRP